MSWTLSALLIAAVWTYMVFTGLRDVASGMRQRRVMATRPAGNARLANGALSLFMAGVVVVLFKQGVPPLWVILTGLAIGAINAAEQRAQERGFTRLFPGGVGLPRRGSNRTAPGE